MVFRLAILGLSVLNLSIAIPAFAQMDPIEVQVLVENHDRKNGVGFPDGLTTPAAEKRAFPQDATISADAMSFELEGNILTLHFPQALKLTVFETAGVHDVEFGSLKLQLDAAGLKYFKWISGWNLNNMLMEINHRLKIYDFLEGADSKDVAAFARKHAGETPGLFVVLRRLEITVNYDQLISGKPMPVRFAPLFYEVLDYDFMTRRPVLNQEQITAFADLERQIYADYVPVNIDNAEHQKIIEAINRTKSCQTYLDGRQHQAAE